MILSIIFQHSFLFFTIITLSEFGSSDDSKDIFKVPNYNSPHRIGAARSDNGVSLFAHAQCDSKMRDDLSV